MISRTNHQILCFYLHAGIILIRIRSELLLLTFCTVYSVVWLQFQNHKHQCYVSTRTIKRFVKTFLMSVFRLHKREKFSLSFVVFQSLLTILPREQNILSMNVSGNTKLPPKVTVFVLPMLFLCCKLVYKFKLSCPFV